MATGMPLADYRWRPISDHGNDILAPANRGGSKTSRIVGQARGRGIGDGGERAELAEFRRYRHAVASARKHFASGSPRLLAADMRTGATRFAAGCLHGGPQSEA